MTRLLTRVLRNSDIDTYRGSGTGRYNGVAGATVEFLFSDAGEPGVNDFAQTTVKDAGGNVVLDVQGKLKNGNHQAHDGSDPSSSNLN